MRRCRAGRIMDHYQSVFTNWCTIG